MSKHKKIRTYIAWGCLIVAILTIGFLLFKELVTPLKTPATTTDIISTAPPKTEPPTPEVTSRHTVPPTHPKHLVIPKLNINTNVYTVGTTKDGAIDAPQTAWGVGWYRDGTLPGNGSGAALIDGHVNDAFNTPGVFYELSSLLVGDSITIIRGDDTQLRYKVVKVTEEPLKDVDMRKVLSPVDANKEGLNLITCGGKFDKATSTYTDRVVVYATRVA